MTPHLRLSAVLLLFVLTTVMLGFIFVAPAYAADTIKPTVSIISPTTNSTVAGSLTIAANASDNVGVTKVLFYLNSDLKYTDSAAPYSFTFNWTDVRNAKYTLTARAYDAAGNIGISAPITVNVKNTLIAPTKLALTTTTKTSISFSWSPSVEGIGHAPAYTIFRNGTELATTSALSFVNSGLNPATTYKYSVMGYDWGGNTSTVSGVLSATTIKGNLLGISTGEQFLGLSTTTLNARLNQLNSLGISWIRFDINWSHLQPNNSSTYNWAYIDSFIAAAKAHHINLLALLIAAPSWAAAPGCNISTETCPPANPATFTTFAKAVATHYASQGIMHWEIWNEPNLGGEWGGSPNATAYTQVLKAAYTGLKAAQPSAIVVTGGMAPAATTGSSIAPVTFFTQMYTAGAEPYFTAVGFHPYSYPAMPSYYAIWNAWSQLASTTPSLRSVMTANGDAGKQIWLTEYGAPTGGPGILETSASDTQFVGGPDHVTEAVQTAMFSQAVLAAQKFPWASTLFWYNYQDLGTAQDTVENFFGIFRYDGSTKPVYQAIKNWTGSN